MIHPESDISGHVDDLIARYTARTARSKDVARAHRARIANIQFFSGFRQRFKEAHYPLVAERSSGARFWDIDGNEYIDFCMGFGAHLFGFNPSFVRDAVMTQLARGVHIGPQAEHAAEAASRFCAITGNDRVFFSNTGTESVMTALRLARTITGRDKVVMFQGAYHGHADHLLLTSAGAGAGAAIPDAAGVPRSFAEDALMLDFGARSALDVIRARGAEIAAILVDPLPAEEGEVPGEEFLRALRDAADATGAALVFDEVLTGLRLHPRGAQGFFEVEADLAAYGKCLAGGLPVGAVAGKARYLDAVDGGVWGYGDDSGPRMRPTVATGTFCRHPLAMAAATAVLRHIEERGPALYQELNGRAARLAERLSEATRGAPLHVAPTGSVVAVEPLLGEHSPLFYWHLALRGVYARSGDCFVSLAHTDDDCDRFVDAVRSTFDELRAAGLFA